MLVSFGLRNCIGVASALLVAVPVADGVVSQYVVADGVTGVEASGIVPSIGL